MVYRLDFFSDAGRFGTGDYGLKKALGHADFYPAGGNDQPICQYKNFRHELKRIHELEVDEIIRSIFGMRTTCEHRMAKVYFIHSLKYPKIYKGYQL